jgi:adenylosuccinate synthase
MIINKHVDVVVGLQYGDEGKGKIAAGISEQCNYDYTSRYNGGANAGHTVTLENDVEVRLHQIPTSIIYKKPGYIGPGALIDFTALDDEDFHFRSKMKFSPYEYLTISPQAIVINLKHKKKDKDYHAKIQGSTSSGVAPAYADFYNRTARLAKEYSWSDNTGQETILDVSEADTMLLEGAQGFYLNPYDGVYPYTTSSSCNPCQAASNFGFPHTKFRHIIGVAKCYETRSGIDPHFNLLMTKYNNLIEESLTENQHQKRLKSYAALQEKGSEIGVTTGRKRQVRYLDLSRLIKAIQSTGTTILVLNKWDILDSCIEADLQIFYNGETILFSNIEEMQNYIDIKVTEHCVDVQKTLFSTTPKNDINWKEHLQDD